uniref:UBN2_2 domain-containing protein n=1 Tax=Ananas comosus var. bracteatus TaxID=296719 RepID=A0A6V7PF99_ANACO|nr:unnamed protein product [Ananas comosus var. bracteatus]
MLTRWTLRSYMDLDLTLRVEQPPKVVGPMTPQQESAQEKWERSNRLSLMLIKSIVSKNIRGSIPECNKAKDYLKAIEEQFVSFDKALASTLMKRFSGIKYNRAKGHGDAEHSSSTKGFKS